MVYVKPPDFWYKRWHPVSQFLRFPSLIFCVIYTLRRILIREKGIFYPPSIGVGSLALGGAGKTAVSLTVAEKIRENKKAKVGLVHSGYGGKKSGVFTNPSEHISDEALLMIMRGFPVSIGKDRVRAVEDLEGVADYVVLDDHFSALVSPLIEMVVFTKESFGNGLVQPFGPLREPVSSLLWADYVLIEDEFRNSPEERRIKRFARNVMYFSFKMKDMLIFKPEKGLERQEIERGKKEVEGGKAVLFSSIAIPRRFRKTVNQIGVSSYAHVSLKDHSFPTQKHIRCITSIIREKRKADFLLTTEKDFWKLIYLMEKGDIKIDFPVFAPTIYAELPSEMEKKILSI